MPNHFYQYYKNELNQFIDQAIKEDIGSGDHSGMSCISITKVNSAKLIVKENGIMAGIKLAEILFHRYDPSLYFQPFVEDGDKVKKGIIAFKVEGNSQSILATERLVLNSMQRMSGIASLTYKLSQKIKHLNCHLLDTRKTTPNFRYPEKWAVKIGGGTNHRMGLFDALMIKDNHVDFCGGMKKTLQKTEKYISSLSKQFDVVVEARNIHEIDIILKFSWVSRILLDNFTKKELVNAIKLIDKRLPTEASGNITENNLIEMAETGVNFISMGALTYAAKPIDLSLQAVLT
ncbi:carboxylating nicotinate-nucleotide diphosphorylase [Flavobacteriaceae bacterium]|nr:carboxylating nicotinate-nucleotide diphosphorylase [Flavobacteriaceae bacterium]|tara:strand:+ start:1076 stop:1945 length:870 start_codon:yes stop_codon:yes gene_type:complete